MNLLSLFAITLRRGARLLMLWSVCTLCLAANSAAPSELEKMFEEGKYAAFQARAVPMADNGDADAQFLLGKAYMLGKGVEIDYRLAEQYFELAAAQHHARAANNLGVILLDQEGDAWRAMDYFKKARALGLEHPALYNQGRAYLATCQTMNESNSCKAGGDIFIQVWNARHENTMMDDAVRAYAMECMVARAAEKRRTGSGESSAAACQRAIGWAEKGSAMGLGRATYNRGAIADNAKQVEEAKKWFTLAVEQGEGLGAYSLAIMHAEGKGFPASAVEALTWYERGAALGNPQARAEMVKHWQKLINTTHDASQVRLAMAQLKKLAPPDTDIVTPGTLRLREISALSANARAFPGLAKAQIRARFCPTEIALYPNGEWWLLATAKTPGEETYEDETTHRASGRVDRQRCIAFSPQDVTALRKIMADGRSAVFRTPSTANLLDLVPDANGALIPQIGATYER